MTATFRSWRSTDVSALLRHAGNRTLWLNLKDRFPHPYTEDDAEEWIGMNHAVLGPTVNFAVDLDGEAVGGVGVELLDDVQSGTATVGYWIAEPFWGRGLATGALRFITEYSFETLPVERLQASVFGWNPASARVLEKVGYRLEGRLRHAVLKDGQIGDLLIFGRLRTDPSV